MCVLCFGNSEQTNCIQVAYIHCGRNAHTHHTIVVCGSLHEVVCAFVLHRCTLFIHVYMFCVLQLFTGRGVLGQVGLYTGLSRPAVQALVFGIVSFNYLAAVNPR